MQERVKTFRSELMEEHRAIIDRDKREIRKMPANKLCISDGLKSSLLKMRKNLVQRRMNLTIYQKTTQEWSLPALRAEVRRRPKKQPSGADAAQGARERGSVMKEASGNFLPTLSTVVPSGTWPADGAEASAGEGCKANTASGAAVGDEGAH